MKKKDKGDSGKNSLFFRCVWIILKNLAYFLLLAFAVMSIYVFVIVRPEIKKVKEYNYADFLNDLTADRVKYVKTTSGSEIANIVLKNEEDILKEREIISEVEGDNNIPKDRKVIEIRERVYKYRTEKEEKEKQTKEKEINDKSLVELLNKENLEKIINGEREYNKTVTVPTLDSFAKFMQEEISTGKLVEFTVTQPPFILKLISLLVRLLPTLVLGVMVYLLVMQMFPKTTKTTEKESKKPDVKFKDVAGLDEEREQLIEVVDFLKDSKKYDDMGAKIPKGVLLYGPPGTGKTLIAKAIAGEANVPFISVSGSEFIEVFSGLGAQRVRRLFAEAKKQAPCIIFIDEIDAIGAKRGSFTGNDSENNQTLNQLLVELDGFNKRTGVIILAATNRPDILDPALLRPGRFDRQIIINAPDVRGREEILKIHAKDKKFESDVDFNEIAKETAGFTGAELENILNEAAIIAAKQNQTKITMEDIEEAIRKVVIGLEKQKRIMSDKDKKITAYHEAGHAIVSHVLETQQEVKEVTIVPRGMAGGYTMYRQNEDKSYISKRELQEDMISLMGGRAAEDIIIKDITTGASNDIERATKIARNMVSIYGMSEKLGPISLAVEHIEELRLYGEDIPLQIGQEVKKLIEYAFETAKNILIENIDALHEVALTLLKKEKINEKEFRSIVDKYIEPRDKKENQIKKDEESSDSKEESWL